MARKFLYVIAVLTVLILGVRLALVFWSENLSEIAFVPDAKFAAQKPLGAEVWQDPRMWIAHPGLQNDPAHWNPPGAKPAARPLDAAVFFVPTTSFMEKGAWNAPLDDPATNARAALLVKGMASPFGNAAQIWAPRYRQATVGAFLTDKGEAQQAIELAYGDVLGAFDTFLKTVPADEPIVLAGHSQGAYMLRRLIRDRIAGTPRARRLVAAYVIGWPVSIEHDLPQMGLPACTSPAMTGCVVSWLSVADPADTGMVTKAYARRRGLDGTTVGAGAFLCTNPLTGTPSAVAAPSANLGTLIPDLEHGTATLEPKAVPAACAADHFLHIGPPPKLDLDRYVLPGNNYHLLDIPLFWSNLRADFERRLEAGQKQWTVLPN